MEAAATVQTAPDFTKLAEQLVELSKFFESIQKSTKVYGDNKEGTKVMKLAEHADVVRSRKEKKLEKIQYQERLKDAKDEFLIGKQIARKEFQINRKVTRISCRLPSLHSSRDSPSATNRLRSTATRNRSPFSP